MQIGNYKLRRVWENKDNQEHYQPAPGVQAQGAYGGMRARGRGGSPLCSRLVPVFICERAASQALEHPDRWSVSTSENGGKWS